MLSEVPWYRRVIGANERDSFSLSDCGFRNEAEPPTGSGTIDSALLAELHALMADEPANEPGPVGHVTTPGPLGAYITLWGTEAPQIRLDRFAVGAGRWGMFPLSCVSMLAAPGGNMKTALAILLGLHVAAGTDFAGHTVTPGGALIVSLEEGAEDMHRRVGATAVTQFDAALHAKLQNRLAVINLAGKNGRFTETMAGRNLIASDLVDYLIEQAKLHAKRTGLPVRFIGIDHARLAMAGDGNESEAVTVLLRALTRVALETGAAVVLLAHSPKSSLNPQREDEFSAADVLGSGAFVDNARFAAVMFPLTATEKKRFAIDADTAKQYVALRVIKSNFSESGQVIYLRKVPVDGWDVAVPVPTELRPPAPALSGAHQNLDARIVDYIAAKPGAWTPDKLAKLCSGDEGPLKAGRPMVKAAVGRLLAVGQLELRTVTAADRAAGNLSARTTHALHVAAPGVANGA